MTKQRTVEIGATVAVSVTFCEADFLTSRKWEEFLFSLDQPKGKKLLIDNLDLDDIKDSIDQSGFVSIEEVER